MNLQDQTLCITSTCLKGYDKDWNPVTDKTTASFGNIHEGSYTFKLKAQSPDGVWSKPLTYTFKVLPPWYRTWWAYTFIGLHSLAALWSFIKWRVRTLKKKSRVIEEKVADKEHELQDEKEKVESTLQNLNPPKPNLSNQKKWLHLVSLLQALHMKYKTR